MFYEWDLRCVGVVLGKVSVLCARVCAVGVWSSHGWCVGSMSVFEGVCTGVVCHVFLVVGVSCTRCVCVVCVFLFMLIWLLVILYIIVSMCACLRIARASMYNCGFNRVVMEF